MLAGGMRTLSRAQLEGRLSLAAPDDVQVALDLIFQEVSTRATACENYPLRISRGLITARANTNRRNNIYEFLLYLSLDEEAEEHGDNPDQLFELVVTASIQGMIGKRGVSCHVGSPALNPRPGKFSEAVTWLVQLMGLPPSAVKPKGNWKDAGVDVIAWWSFPDARDNFMVLLVQTTITRSRWPRKADDPVPASWGQWLGLRGMPMKGIAVPFAVDRDDGKWDEAGKRAVLVLDRVRLAHLTTLPKVIGRTRIDAWRREERRRLKDQG